jgi:hypothetical protein
MSNLTELPEPLYLRQKPRFQAANTNFDFDTARAMAWAAQLAYETNHPEKIAGILAAWNWTLRGFHAGRVSSVLPLTSAKGFIAARDGVSILTFAGTEPTALADWIVDFSIHQNADGIHAGFKAGVAAVWPEISAILGAGGSAATDRLFITGHSLGGALAAVAALRLVQDNVVALDRLLGVYTFGMPRVGNDTFARDYRTIAGRGLADRTYRFVDGVDIVPQVPPPEIPFDFRHIGCALACAHGELFQAGNLVPDAAEQVPAQQSALLRLAHGLVQEPPARDLPPFPGDPAAAILIDHLRPPVRDHLMDRYLRALTAL